MFDITSIQIKDFKSYAGEHEFDFPTQAGLYFLTGSNQQQPRLESNGAGKSTLLDAIYWCLFGKTTRGLKANDVVTWGERSCSVRLTLLLNDTELTVTRTQNPNTIVVEGQNGPATVDQSILQDKILGLTPEAFAYSVMMPQYNQSFFELTPAAKLALFSSIMGLESWLELSQKAAKAAAELDKEILEATRKIGGYEIAVDGAKAELESLSIKESNFDDECQLKVENFYLQKKEIEAELLEAKNDASSAEEILSDITEVIGDKAKVIDGIRNNQETYAERCDKLNKEYATAEVMLKTLAEAHDALTKVTVKCPVCLQKVNQTHIKTERQAAYAKLEAARSEFRRIEQEFNTANKFLRKAVKDRNDLIAELEGLRQEERKAARAVQTLAVEMKQLDTELKALDVSISTEKARSNPYSKLISEKHDTIEAYKAKQDKLTKELNDLNANHDAVFYWVGGFKRIRLMIIEDTLRSLEVEVNNNLANLGLTDWRIEFDVERETKAGTVTKGFVVLVRAPGQAEATRLEVWSGGETQRLQLACDLGLANLIMQQAGYVNAIEFYDEPSKHLSKAGLLDLAETLHQRAIENEKRIFLVDHNMPEFGDFADVITVNKDINGHSHLI